jgi:recombination protein RecA
MPSKKSNVGIENLKGFQIGANLPIKDLIPTGHPELDYAIAAGIMDENENFGSGGLPLGKLVLFYGNEGSGKSSLAYRVVGSAQRMNYKCAWVDTEHSFSNDLADINGVIKEDLYYSNLIDLEDPNKISSAENVMDMIINACASKNINVIVLDSVANLVPERVIENDADKDTVAELARVLSKTLGKLLSYAAQNNVLVIFINQLREKIGTMFGNPDTMPGGRSLKHNSSLILKVSKLESKEHNIMMQIDDGSERLIGRYSNVFIEKNRFARPHQGAVKVPIYYESYFPDISDFVFEAGRTLKVIKVRNGVFSWGSIKADGRKAFIEKISDAEVLDGLISEVKQQAKEIGTILPIEIVKFEKQKYIDSIKVTVNLDANNKKSSYDTEHSRALEKENLSV